MIQGSCSKMYMNGFLPLQCAFLTSFSAAVSSAHSIQPHWCSFSFSNMTISLPPHSWSPYRLLSLPGISFPLLFACLFSSLIQMWSHVTFWENLSWWPYIVKHTCFSPFTLIFVVHIFLQLICIWYGHIVLMYCLPFQIEHIPHEAEIWICGVLLIAKV